MSATARRVRTAVVGAGNMGARHARIVDQSEDSDLVLVVDSDEATGRKVADSLDVAWAPELRDPSGLDALVIALPPRHHPQLVTDALGADLAVLVEKPMATTIADVDNLIDVARASKGILSCGFVERFNPAVMTMMDEVGAPLHMLAQRHSPFGTPSAAGVAMDLAIHDVDLAIRLVGTGVTRSRASIGVFSAGTPHESDDVADISMRFTNGSVATVSASRIGQRKIRTWQVAEAERMFDVDLVRQEVTIYRHVGADFLDNGSVGFRQQTIVDMPVITYRHEPLAAQWAHMLDLVGGRADPGAELDSIHEPHRIIAAELESSLAYGPRTS